VQELPQKDFYKLSEVCQYTDTQPYVLRFWESEFPQLKPGKSASGQRLYRRKDVAVVCRIKELLYDEEQTLDDAREQLAEELATGKRLRVPSRKTITPVAQDEPAAHGLPIEQESEPSSAVVALRRVTSEGQAPVRELHSVSRERYERAIDEIDHLRLALKESDKEAKRAETLAEEAREAVERERTRANKAVSYLERLRDILS
jgi:DNA-binding transcriptional MerR regulator